MSDVRKQIEHYATEIFISGFYTDRAAKEVFLKELISLYPSWQSFEEAKPEVGEIILVKLLKGDGIIDDGLIVTYWDRNRHHFINAGYQWLRIPE